MHRGPDRGYDLTVPMLTGLSANVCCLGFAAWLCAGRWRHRHALDLAT